MGSVVAEITLRNGGDIVLARNGHITEQNIRSLSVTALVDTGATTLVIGEDTRERLGLVVTDTHTVTLAGGSEAFCGITEPVEICWKNRKSSVRAWVLPGEKQVLIGVIPLEEMDLIVDPISQKLVGAHGEKAMGLIK
jgi:clan AA aspartic protease